MDFFVNVNYIIEVLLAELFFLSPFPRQKRFVPRLILVLITAAAAGCFEATHRNSGGLFSFLCMTGLLGLTVLGMTLVFHGTFLSILAACTSGVALQHISHHLSRLAAMTLGFEPWNAWWEFVTCLLLDVIALLFLIRPLRRTRYYEVEDARITAVSLLIVLLCTGLTRLLRLSGTLNNYGIVCTSLYAITCCVLALFIQFFLYCFVQFKSDYLLQKRIREEERQQYELSREKDELINIKYHDLKHQIAGLRCETDEEKRKKWIDAMEEEVSTFANAQRTGNQVLDTILAAKIFHCRKNNISITCVADGMLLDFIHVTDICSIFGNALDNAIEHVTMIPDKEKRLIHVTVSSKKGFVLIKFENYCETPVQKDERALIRTTKADKKNHGYGLSSIRATAEKYGGIVDFEQENDWFYLNILIPREQ